RGLWRHGAVLSGSAGARATVPGKRWQRSRAGTGEARAPVGLAASGAGGEPGARVVASADSGRVARTDAARDPRLTKLSDAVAGAASDLRRSSLGRLLERRSAGGTGTRARRAAPDGGRHLPSGRGGARATPDRAAASRAVVESPMPRSDAWPVASRRG